MMKKNNVVKQVACVATSIMQNVIVEIVCLKCAVIYLTCDKCFAFFLSYNIKLIIYVSKD